MRGAAPHSRPHSGASAKSDRSTKAVPGTTHASLLDASSDAAGDALQWTIEQNKQLLLSLKAENRELKQELSRGSAPARDSGKSHMDKAAEKLEKSVHGLRRQYDKLMQDKKTALSRLSNLQDSVRELSKASGATKPGVRSSSSGGPAAGAGAAGGLLSREIRQLENRLEKAMLKANEAQSIKGTYEQVLEKLAQEQATLNARSSSAEEAFKAAHTEHDKLIISSKEAQHAKEQAKQELAAFEEKLRGHRQRWERQLEEQRAQAQVLQQTNAKLLQRQYPNTAQQQQQQQDKALAAPSPAAEPSFASAAPVGADGSTGPAVSDAAQAVRQLCEKAGCSSVRELLSSLSTQQDSHRNLQEMKRVALEQLTELEGDMALARSHLEEVHGGGRLTTQSQLDSAQVELREANAKAEEARQLHEQVSRMHADVCSGLDHLASMAAVLPAPPGLPAILQGSAQGDPEQALEVLAQCEQRLVAAHKFILGFPKAVQMLDDMSSNPDLSFNTAVGPQNAPLKLP